MMTGKCIWQCLIGRVPTLGFHDSSKAKHKSFNDGGCFKSGIRGFVHKRMYEFNMHKNFYF